MPILDMPLSKLKTYNGISPKPSDFDEFWDNELKKIHAYDGNYTLTAYPTLTIPNVVIEEMNFIAPDGSNINCRITRPDDNEKHPVIFRFHGKHGNIGPANVDLSFVPAGFAVASMNCRSQASFSNDCTARGVFGQADLIVRGLNKGRDFLYYKDVFLDVVRFVDIIKSLPFADENRLYAHGGSQGGGLTVVCAALCPEIKACVPYYPFLSDYKRLYEMDLLKDAYNEIREYLRFYCPEENELRDKMWETLGYIDIQYLAPRIKADTLWFTGLMDNVCPPSTQFAAYNKITAKKDMVVFTNHGHEGNWIYDERTYSFLLKHAQEDK